VPFFVCSIVMVDDRYGDFYLCIPFNILYQLMYNLACNKFPPGVAGVDRTSGLIYNCNSQLECANLLSSVSQRLSGFFTTVNKHVQMSVAVARTMSTLTTNMSTV